MSKPKHDKTLPEMLREFAASGYDFGGVEHFSDAESALLREAAERIEALETALRPFAHMGEQLRARPLGRQSKPDSVLYAIHGTTTFAAEITVGDLERARALLSPDSLPPSSDPRNGTEGRSGAGRGLPEPSGDTQP